MPLDALNLCVLRVLLKRYVHKSYTRIPRHDLRRNRGSNSLSQIVVLIKNIVSLVKENPPMRFCSFMGETCLDLFMVVFGSCFIDTLKVMNNTMSN